MPEARATKKIFKWNPLTTRPRGRPRYRREENIKQDLGQMKIKNWLIVSRIEQSGGMSLRRPKPPINRRFSA